MRLLAIQPVQPPPNHGRHTPELNMSVHPRTLPSYCLYAGILISTQCTRTSSREPLSTQSPEGDLHQRWSSGSRAGAKGIHVSESFVESHTIQANPLLAKLEGFSGFRPRFTGAVRSPKRGGMNNVHRNRPTDFLQLNYNYVAPTISLEIHRLHPGSRPRDGT